MNDSKVQFIEKDGTPQYAVLPIEYYREIVSLLDDFKDYSAIDQAVVDDQDGKTVPASVVNSILDGNLPLRAWRESRGITLSSLAERVGLSKSYLSQIETGRKPGTLALFQHISIILDVSIDDLVEWGDEKRLDID